MIFTEPGYSTQLIKVHVEKGEVNPIQKIMIEHELINPLQVNKSFNTYTYLSDTTPTKESYTYRGKNWGSGSGLGALIVRENNICNSCNYSILVEAYENSIIQIRAHGYGPVRQVEPY